MSHGVHAVQHEVDHHIKHEEHGHAHGEGHHEKKPADNNKRIALFIAVMALFLAFSETLGKSAQTEGISLNIKASDTWNFFQAKTIRQTSLRTAAEAMALQLPGVTNETEKAAMTKQIETWRATVARYESDPVEKDGRKELRAQAEKYEHDRDTFLSKYHHYEYASAAFQIGIVLASAAVLTGMMILVYAGGLLGLFGIGFMVLGYFDPHLLHALHLI